jgi:hypothetical protein
MNWDSLLVYRNSALGAPFLARPMREEWGLGVGVAMRMALGITVGMTVEERPFRAASAFPDLVGFSP